ncbi:hypothetical protein HK102_004236 [Quaeritorhiza haematococci]|nr:hypothetical protein HK102_004236 [Quaeritorhiza haematococci]
MVEDILTLEHSTPSDPVDVDSHPWVKSTPKHRSSRPQSAAGSQNVSARGSRRGSNAGLVMQGEVFATAQVEFKPVSEPELPMKREGDGSSKAGSKRGSGQNSRVGSAVASRRQSISQ